MVLCGAALVAMSSHMGGAGKPGMSGLGESTLHLPLLLAPAPLQGAGVPKRPKG